MTMAKVLKTSDEGRKCMFLDCGCILSIYNGAKYCHRHLAQIAEAEKPTDAVNPAAAVK